MAQFYLLSVVSCILTGLVLSGDYLGARVPAFATFRAWLENRGAALALGLATAAVGFIKLFVRAPGDSVAVVGDHPYPGVPAGVVLRQNPQAGFQIAPGEPISIEVSR